MFTALKQFTAWLRAFLRTRDLDRDFEQELDAHIAMLTEDNIGRGMTHEEARRSALIRVGAGASLKDQHREARGLPALETAWRDVRYALRMLSRAPAFSAMAILTLALGIGANTAVFSALDAVLLRPLPFPDSDRLVRLRQRDQKGSETNIAPIRLEDWNRLATTFEGMTGYSTEETSDISAEIPEMVRRASVAPRFLQVWGVAPALGRGFAESDHRAGDVSPVVISDRYWRRRFGGDPNVLGKTVRLAGGSLSVVAVMPASFLFPDREVDLWVPTVMGATLRQARYARWYTGIGRLKPGATVEQARANLAVVQGQLADEYPNTDRVISPDVQPLKDSMIGDLGSSLWLLFSAVSVLLLIACTNIAALLLSRAADRRQEIAVRVALGATRKQVAMQMLAETAVLALAGSVLGLMIAAAAIVPLRAAAIELPRLEEITIDGRILLYTFLSAALVTLLCGVVPALRTSRQDAAATLNEAVRTQVSGGSSFQWLLVGAQVALSVTLLIAAGLLVRSFYELSRVQPGFETNRVLTFRISGSYAETNDNRRLIQRIEHTLEALEALPGVQAAATATFLPGTPFDYESLFELKESQTGTADRLPAQSRFVSPEFFGTMQIPLVAGAPCRRQAQDDVRQLMVNESFVARYLSAWPSPVGLHLSGDSRVGRIVGVVADTRDQGVDQVPGPTVYTCFSAANPFPYFLVRTQGDPLAIAQTVRVRLKQLEPLRSVYDLAPLDARIGEAFTEDRLRTIVLALFSATALVLASVGLYGTLGYVISRRRREVGLRLALGAKRGDIIQQFLGQGLRVAAVACVCGLTLAFATRGMLSGMLFGVSPSDPVTLSSVIGIVLMVTTMAALIPAVRAAFVQPTRALRDE
jgi:predicted permease